MQYTLCPSPKMASIDDFPPFARMPVLTSLVGSLSLPCESGLALGMLRPMCWDPCTTMDMILSHTDMGLALKIGLAVSTSFLLAGSHDVRSPIIWGHHDVRNPKPVVWSGHVTPQAWLVVSGIPALIPDMWVKKPSWRFQPKYIPHAPSQTVGLSEIINYFKPLNLTVVSIQRSITEALWF